MTPFLWHVSLLPIQSWKIHMHLNMPLLDLMVSHNFKVMTPLTPKGPSTHMFSHPILCPIPHPISCKSDSVRHKKQASTRTHSILHPIPHPIPFFPVAQAVRMYFPKFYGSKNKLSTISEIGIDWCRMGNRMGIRFACKSGGESDAKTYV
jgi:hypothetical protein